ncbi:hydrogenase formation protein HypD [Candidatus Latescibacterota bacterium]
MLKNPYRSRKIVKDLSAALHEEARNLEHHKIMHVCGTHEHEINRFGLRQLLPDNISLIAGPGCPVCITPASVIVTAIALALQPDNPIFCTYGDMVRVPTSEGSILDSRGKGADVRVVYSIREAISLAVENPERRVVFLSVGFETTAAPVAATVKAGLPDNFLMYCCHRYVPTAVEALTAVDKGNISGYLLPGHASVITGIEPYSFLPERYNRAAALSGFEPVDILAALLSIVRQIRRGQPVVANCYKRAVRDSGNRKARAVLAEVFDCTDASWRGIGILPGTGFELKEEYERYDALTRYEMEELEAEDVMKGCICHLVLTGQSRPDECGLFGKACTPLNPQGPCMVSIEGTCRALFLYPEENDV